MYTQRPPPGRRRHLTSIMLPIITLILLISPILAQSTPEDQLTHQELFDRYAAQGEIHTAVIAVRRQVGEASVESSSTTSTSSVASASETSETTSDEPSSSATKAPSPSKTTASIPTDSAAPLPVAFDTFSPSNFTATSCPTFFNTFLANSTLKQCAPISLLLQNSASFIAAQRSPDTLQYLLDTACSAPLSICAATMMDIARQLISDTYCGADFRAGQPLVVQAYNGLVGYEPIATATCQTVPVDEYNSTTVTVSPAGGDKADEQYCFLSAITNKVNPSDPFPYYTAIGLNLPQVAKPTCNSCLKAAMGVMAEWAVRKEQPLASTYLGCANVVAGVCGKQYADTTVAVGSVADSVQGIGAKNAEQGSTGAAGRSAVPVMVMTGAVGLLGIVLG